MRYFTLLFLLPFILAGCYNPGTIKNALTDTSFVNSSDASYFYDEEDHYWYIAGFNGIKHKKLFAGYFPEAVSQDSMTFILQKFSASEVGEGGLYVTRDGGRTIREVEWFHGRLVDVDLSPDGNYAVIVRHADYTLPQDQWVEDPAIYLLNTDSLKFKKITEYKENNPGQLFWLDEKHVIVSYSHIINDEIINVESGETTFSSEEKYRKAGDPPLQKYKYWISRSRRWNRYNCGIRHQEGDDGIIIEYPDGKKKHLVIIEGRKRGFHDYMQTVTFDGFTSDCRYLLFYFKQDLWVVELRSGKVGSAPNGGWGRFDPWYPPKINTK